jgi:hypothetical protein
MRAPHAIAPCVAPTSPRLTPSGREAVSRICKALFLFGLAIAAIGMCSSTVSAAPITAFSTTYGNGQAAGSVLTYGPNNAVNAQNGAPPNIVGNLISGLSLTLTGAHPAGNGPVTFSPTFTINGTSVEFTFLGPLNIVGYMGGPPSSFNVIGEAFVSQADANFGAGLINQIWVFTFTANGADINFGSPGTFSTANTSTASATFIATGRFREQGDPTPEPATLATLGLMGLMGGFVARRKLKASAAAQA